MYTASPSTHEIELYRYTPRERPGDLTHLDLITLYGLLRDEKLLSVFFHDRHVRDLRGFLSYATDPGNWFCAAFRKGEWIGIGVANNFTSSGNTAYVHLVSFAAGRDGSFREAGTRWFEWLAACGITTAIGVVPACYRGTWTWAASFGFEEQVRLPGALRIYREKGDRVTDAIVSLKRL